MPTHNIGSWCIGRGGCQDDSSTFTNPREYHGRGGPSVSLPRGVMVADPDHAPWAVAGLTNLYLERCQVGGPPGRGKAIIDQYFNITYQPRWKLTPRERWDCRLYTLTTHSAPSAVPLGSLIGRSAAYLATQGQRPCLIGSSVPSQAADSEKQE